MKIYQHKNVFDAACERIEYVFANFERIYVSFSGGKDSAVLLQLVLRHMRRCGIKRPIGCLFIDLEAQYERTIQFAQTLMRENGDLLEPYWVCLPLNLRNAVSTYEPFWCCWQPGAEWVRPMPAGCISDETYFPFWRHRMEFEEFVPAFGEWYSGGQRTACLVGIRSDESLNRYRTIASDKKECFDGQCWTTRISNSLYNAYPIYDWRTEDVWTANAREGFSYNRLYDLFHKAGLGIHAMRICQPYGDDQRIGLNLFRIVEPQTWAKVVNRVSGANFGNIYCGTKMLGFHKVHLPSGHTWRSYTKMLLASLPPETSENYRGRFAKFIRYWRNVGCPVSLPHDMLPPEAVVTDHMSTRGDKYKKLVRYRQIPDSLAANVESSRSAPTWRRMAACILKNDHLCKGLSFTQTKDQAQRTKALIEKYRKL